MDETTFGRYVLIKQLTSTDLGESWRAHDAETGQQVVVQILPEEFSLDDDAAENIYREARAAAAVHDPHLPTIIDVGEIDDRICVTTTFIDGQTLDHVLLDDVLPPEHAVSVVEQIASALSAAHHAGLVHGRVTTANIVLAQNNFAYLTGLGIAPDIDVDEADDVHWLAQVLAECLGPEGRTASDALADVVAKGTADDPDVRYTSAKQLARDARAAVPAPDLDGDFAGALRIAPMPRPATVTAACVLAFFQTVFFCFLFVVHLSVVVLVEDGWFAVDGLAETMTTRAVTVVLGIATAAVACLLIYGAVLPFVGRSGQVLRYAEQAAALVAAVGYGVLIPLYMTAAVVGAAVIILLLALPPSRQYFGPPTLHSANQFDVDLTELDRKLDNQSMVALITVAVLLALGWVLFLIG